MARRRYISTLTSVDKTVNKLATTAGDFALALYLLMIPHAEDDGTLTGDPEELLAVVLPMRRDKSAEDVAAALEAMHNLQLICWDKERCLVLFPGESFYKYQSYIKPGNRRDEERKTPQNADESKPSLQDSEKRRKTPQNAVSPSLPHSHSHSHSRRTANGDESVAKNTEGASGGDTNAALLAERKRRLEENPHWEEVLQSKTPANCRNPVKYQAPIWREWVEYPERAPKPPEPPSEEDRNRTLLLAVRKQNPMRQGERTEDYTRRLSEALGHAQRETAQ